MEGREVARRALMAQAGAAAGLALLRFPGVAQAAAQAFPSRPGEEVLTWLDQPAANPVPQIVGPQLQWERLRSFLTPVDQFFTVAHYGQPAVDAGAWRLEVGGLVGRPMTLTLDALRARPRQEVTFTLECSGNHGFPFFTGGIGTASWAGTPLAPLLREAGPLPTGTEVVFWGADAGPGPVGDQTVVEQFARSMSLADALDPNILLCYEMNGAPLHPAHGFPVRLLAPGWYGVANVKWLTRIEVLNTRYEGRFMAREYVTQRTVQQDGIASTRFTSVGRALLKSAPARVVRGAQYRVEGVAWGAPIGRVEARIDGGAWQPATLVDADVGSGFAWRRWRLDLGQLARGEHTISSRAIDTSGRVQPAPEDPLIANKLTFWESNGQITRRVRIA